MAVITAHLRQDIPPVRCIDVRSHINVMPWQGQEIMKHNTRRIQLWLAILLAVSVLALGDDDKEQATTTMPAEIPELKVLSLWQGTWDVNATRHQPDPATVNYRETFTWVLDGRFLKGETSLKSDGNKSMSMATYDQRIGAYRFWTFDSTSFASELPPAEWQESTRTMKWSSGFFNPLRFESRVTFIDDDTINWQVLLKDWKGTVIYAMDGTSIRRK